MENSIPAYPESQVSVLKQQTPFPPFLRWAGGKRWLVHDILEMIGDVPIRTYYEPFLGGGSVFFGIQPEGKAVLSDLNTDLITVYRQIRDNPNRIADLLMRYKNTPECYYSARANKPTNDDEISAWFIFLNHTSYNGIFRVNLKGEYNVPYGKRKYVHMPDRDFLTRASHILQGVELYDRSFEISLKTVSEGDLVFLDPPYTVAHNNNGFVKYNQHLFSFNDQQRLAKSIERIIEKRAKFILTNAAHTSIDELFSPLGRRIEVSRRNAVGGLKANRGKTTEYLFTNLGEK
ncbi:MAG: Dam family site-specific DNA-(adenine-N6)-methyltransferase [Bifidobacterium sp.]|jgi:DNA adenine methylase|nr:Dam family site-specific DNA-(adenine-N6)-methyltransferase [Bifidobacterium sp.]